MLWAEGSHLAWHVIRTASNQERSVSRQLNDQNLQAFCPMTTVPVVRRGRIREEYQALFRNYTFANWDATDASLWHKVRKTDHVINIIGGETPAPVEAGVVESWQRRARDHDIIEDLTSTVADLKRGYRVGSLVRLQRGREDAMQGIVVWVDDKLQTVGVRLDLLGRNPIVVRRQRDVEPVSLPTKRRRNRGGKRGNRVRQQAFHNHVASLL